MDSYIMNPTYTTSLHTTAPHPPPLKIFRIFSTITHLLLIGYPLSLTYIDYLPYCADHSHSIQ